MDRPAYTQQIFLSMYLLMPILNHVLVYLFLNVAQKNIYCLFIKTINKNFYLSKTNTQLIYEWQLGIILTEQCLA